MAVNRPDKPLSLPAAVNLNAARLRHLQNITEVSSRQAWSGINSGSQNHSGVIHHCASQAATDWPQAALNYPDLAHIDNHPLPTDDHILNNTTSLLLTYWTAYDMGIAIGSAGWGPLAAALGYSSMYLLSIVPVVTALIIYLARAKSILSVSPARGYDNPA